MIDRSGIRPDTSKLKAIVDFPRPDTTTKLRAFLGLASFYRQFILGFASIARPLHSLLRENVDVVGDWGPEQDAAMEDLKTRLTSAPVLVHDDGVSDIEIQTDASVKGIGAVLLLKTERGSQPVTFITRRMTAAEEKYHANELECLALVWALNKLRQHVYGRKFTVKTDSNVLRWLYRKKDVSGKFARWILTLQEYDIDLCHMSGKINLVADALSRSPADPPETIDPTERMLCSLEPDGYSRQQLAVFQDADTDIRQIIRSLQGINNRPEYALHREQYTLHRGVLYRHNQRPGRRHLLVIPSILRKEILTVCHDTPTVGHHRIEKTAKSTLLVAQHGKKRQILGCLLCFLPVVQVEGWISSRQAATDHTTQKTIRTTRDRSFGPFQNVSKRTTTFDSMH